MTSLLTSVRPERDGTYSLRGPGGFNVYIPEAVASNTSSNSYIQNSRNLYGNFTPLLRGRIVLGPQPKYFVIHVLGLLTVLFILAFQSNDIEKQFGPVTLITGFVLHVISFILFLCISLSDPGVVPRNYTMTELIADTQQYRERNPDQRFYRFCSKCDGFRPPRCYHCNRCNICIRDQEVHLLSGGICVGKRTARSFFWMSLFLGAFAWYLIVINILILIKMGKQIEEGKQIRKTVLTFVSGLFGFFLLCVPQVGILMFLFRIFYIGSGNTTRMFINASRPDELDCAQDRRKTCENFNQFFLGKKGKSVFRKSYNQIEPEFGIVNNDWITATSFLNSRDSRELIQLLQTNNNQVDYNNNSPVRISPTTDNIEAMLLRDLAANARPKSIPSVPQLHDGELEQVPGTRLKTPLKSKPCQMLQIQLDQFQKDRQLSKSVISHRKNLNPLSTLSEGSLPRTCDGTQNLISAARADQFRKIVNLVLLRDREGLVQMARRINLAGLLGIEQFDPDNLQFVELFNGLPMLASVNRRDTPRNFYRFGGLLGVPQMAAAGLLPSAGQIAVEAESQLGLGPGSVVRVPNQPRHGHWDPNEIRARLTIPASTLGYHRVQSRPLFVRDRNTADHQQHQNLNRLLMTQRRLQNQAMQRLRNIAFGHPLWGGRLSVPMSEISNMRNNQAGIRLPNVTTRGFHRYTVNQSNGSPSSVGHPPVGTIIINNLDTTASIVAATSTMNPAIRVETPASNPTRPIDIDNNNQDNSVPTIMVLLNDGTLHRPPNTRNRES